MNNDVCQHTMCIPYMMGYFKWLIILVQEQGLNNFEFGDTQYAQGLTSDYYRGDPGDCPYACCNMELWYTFFSMEGQRSKVTQK